MPMLTHLQRIEAGSIQILPEIDGPLLVILGIDEDIIELDIG